jgi:hypothetical protein
MEMYAAYYKADKNPMEGWCGESFDNYVRPTVENGAQNRNEMEEMKIIRFRELSRSRKGEREGNEVNAIFGTGIDIPIGCEDISNNRLAKSVSKAISFFLKTL